MPERDKYLRGLASWVGFKQTFVDFDRNERVAGETKYTLKKMINLQVTLLKIKFCKMLIFCPKH